jgi:hypothetical protein
MSRSYPELGIMVIGEPSDVQALADRLEESANEIEGISFPAMKIVTDRLDGPTRQRALAAVQAMTQGSVSDITGSLYDSAGTLREWAGTIEEYRSEFDRLELEVDHMKQELAVKEPRLEYLRAHGDPATDSAEVMQLWGEVGTLKRSIQANVEYAHAKLDEYEDKAEEVGSSLQSDALSSPAASEGQRFTRELLGISAAIGNLLDIGGYASLLLGGIGALPGKALGNVAKEALDRAQDSVERATVAGAGAKLTADAGATAGGVGLSPAELFFNALNLKGIGPIAKIKDDALNQIESEAGRLTLGEAINRLEGTLTDKAFPESRPAR